jgi:hypothetical protein
LKKSEEKRPGKEKLIKRQRRESSRGARRERERDKERDKESTSILRVEQEKKAPSVCERERRAAF